MDIDQGIKTTPVSARSLTGCRHRLALEARAPQGEPYRRIVPVAPQHPVVPATAPGALRLPLYVV